MSEILLVISMPLAAYIIELGKAKRIPANVLIAALSLVAGTVYLAWYSLATPDLKAWVISVYPLFAVGTVGFYRLAKEIVAMREERLKDEAELNSLHNEK